MKKADDRTVARVVILNLLVLPGLGSIRAQRWLEGVGQIVLAITGSAITLVWLYKELAQYYGLMFDDVKQQSVGWIGITGAILIGTAWVWATITSINYHRANALQGAPVTQNIGVEKKTISVPPVISIPESLPYWQRTGGVIARTFQFKDFPAAMKFVDTVALVAEQVQHHPDIDIRWNKVTLALTTHDAGGLTEKDFALARKCDALSQV
jgi:4a-hydroxytetrahydrobiopterin dehydratase